MPAEPPQFDPERILEVLDRHGVDYVMVGGFASQLHGARRQTYDIDVVPAATEANDDRLASALRELGARLRVAGLTDEEARELPVTVDAATLRAFGSTTWTTAASASAPTAIGRSASMTSLPNSSRSSGPAGSQAMASRTVPAAEQARLVVHSLG